MRLVVLFRLLLASSTYFKGHMIVIKLESLYVRNACGIICLIIVGAS
jgi:hypothetical protein